jgi:hypothetical protein
MEMDDSGNDMMSELYGDLRFDSEGQLEAAPDLVPHSNHVSYQRPSFLTFFAVFG